MRSLFIFAFLISCVVCYGVPDHSIRGLDYLMQHRSSRTQSTKGLKDLVNRRMPDQANQFVFELVDSINATKRDVSTSNDNYMVSSRDSTVLVQGTSLSALSTGLHQYLKKYVHADVHWFIGSQLHLAPAKLPMVERPLYGSSIVPLRYHFNTVTFSYTSAFWSWEDWEVELDWLALRGVNLPLAWVGQEKLLVDTYRELGLTDEEISSFLSGPAFQSWNRFGNIQGSWGGELPSSWIDSQFELQKKIIHRMVDLGMTPVLPAFTGFVPRGITRVFPDADVVNGSAWNAFPERFTNDTFLSPGHELFAQIQKSFMTKQIEAYGNVTNVWTLDQYNENTPFSGDTDYLGNITRNTWSSLKAADPAAVWLMQGWLFYAFSSFWTDERIEAYLDGVPENNDMLVLDLFSESAPQWQRTNSYYGKPWIWCQLHDFGGTLGIYGQIENITVNPIEALASSDSLVGFGLTPEAQEGNEIIYELLLDQAWSSTPIDTEEYFADWVTARYSQPQSQKLPSSLYHAWDILRTTAYNNTNATIPTVSKPIPDLEPSINGLLHMWLFLPTDLSYKPSDMVSAWKSMFHAALTEPQLWEDPAYQYDLVDITRQVLANDFLAEYASLVKAYNNSAPADKLAKHGHVMVDTLHSLDKVLNTNEHFRLSTWINAARSWADSDSVADFYEYNARNQITLWGPNGEIHDYASKTWGGLVSSYYLTRWEIFMKYIKEVPLNEYNGTALHNQIREFELDWQTQTLDEGNSYSEESLRSIVQDLIQSR